MIFLLPMKAHSERVSNKNLKVFSGKPLFFRVLQELSRSKFLSSITINTDSKQIAQYATNNFQGVTIHWRSKNVRGDFVSMNDVIGDSLQRVNADHFLQTHSTNPLLTAQTVDRAIEQYFNKLDKYDSLFSVTRLQTRLYCENGNPINHNPAKLLRTQDLPPVYEENSNFYIFSKKSFADAGGSRIGLTPQMFEISKLEAVDIDGPEDWEIAEILYKRRANK